MEMLALQVSQLELGRIKAHVNIEGNEESDKAAKKEPSGGLHVR